MWATGARYARKPSAWKSENAEPTSSRSVIEEEALKRTQEAEEQRTKSEAEELARQEAEKKEATAKLEEQAAAVERPQPADPVETENPDKPSNPILSLSRRLGKKVSGMTYRTERRCNPSRM